MKDYVKREKREKNLENVILHVGTNEIHSDLPPWKIANLVIMLLKKLNQTIE